MDKLKTLGEVFINDTQVLALMEAKEWFGEEAGNKVAFLGPAFVVVRYSQYSNGRDLSYEGKVTLAACADRATAELVYAHYKGIATTSW